MPNWEFGIRCTEDASGNLWVGKPGVTKFETAFPHLENKVKSKLEEARGSRSGAFWVNFERNSLYIVTNTSTETGEYPEVSLD